MSLSYKRRNKNKNRKIVIDSPKYDSDTIRRDLLLYGKPIMHNNQLCLVKV